jgi:hypothetical protein
MYTSWDGFEDAYDGEAEWHKFERFCFALINESINPSIWRVKYQHRIYPDDRSKRVDFHIAELRQGGNGYVVDCKHFPRAIMSTNEIYTTLEYKKICRASGAIILVSSATRRFTNDFFSVAEQHNVKVVPVNIETIGKIRIFFHSTFGRRDFDLGIEPHPSIAGRPDPRKPRFRLFG